MDISWISTRVSCTLFVYLSLAVLTTRSECPPDAMEQAEKCTEIFGLEKPTGGPSPFITAGSADKAIHACGNGDLLNAVNCMERVKTQCEHDKSDPAHFLRSMLDIEKARRAVQYFCTNVRVYAQNADCIAQHHNETGNCAREEFQSFVTLTDATQNLDVQMRYQCIFFWAASRCTEKVVKSKCNAAAADIVGTVLKGLEPPRCATMTYSFNSERTDEVSSGEAGGDGGRVYWTGGSDTARRGDQTGNENSSTSAGFSALVFLLPSTLLLIRM